MSISNYQKARDKLTFRDNENSDEIDSEEGENLDLSEEFK